MKLLDKYAISLNLFVLLLVLSPLPTSFYSTNIIEYIWLSFLFVFSITIIEFYFNKAGYNKKEKGKKIYLYIMPIHLIIFTILLFLIFI